MLKTGHHGFSLPHVPPELVMEILEWLSPPDLLSFAIASKSCYDLAIPILGRYVLVAQDNLCRLKERIASHHPRNQLVQFVRVGQLKGTVPWDIQDVLHGVLDSYPRLRTLETRGGSYIQDWVRLDDVGQVLGQKLTELQARLVIQNAIGTITQPVLFPFLQKLDLELILLDESNADTILSNIHARFSSVVELTIRFHSSTFEFPYPRPELFIFRPSNPIFPSLQIFHLIFNTETYEELDHDGMNALYDFLHKHSSTLREFTLPSNHVWHGVGDYDVPTSFDCLRLRTLTASLQFAWLLVEHGCLALETLEELRLNRAKLSGSYPICLPLNFHFRSRPRDKVCTLRRFANAPIRVLGLRYFPAEVAAALDVLPTLFPELEELHVDYNNQSDDQRLMISPLNETCGPFLLAATKLRIITTQGIYGRASKCYYRVVRDDDNRNVKIELEDVKAEGQKGYWETHF